MTVSIFCWKLFCAEVFHVSLEHYPPKHNCSEQWWMVSNLLKIEANNLTWCSQGIAIDVFPATKKEAFLTQFFFSLTSKTGKKTGKSIMSSPLQQCSQHDGIAYELLDLSASLFAELQLSHPSTVHKSRTGIQKLMLCHGAILSVIRRCGKRMNLWDMLCVLYLFFCFHFVPGTYIEDPNPHEK